MTTVRDLQTLLGVLADGAWGPKSQAALDALLHRTPIEHHVFASSFADPRDVIAFSRCKAQGKSDQECFKVGDNAIGCWGDNTALDLPMVALPPEHLLARWGSIANAQFRAVTVTHDPYTIRAIVADRMPSLSHITNGAGIDLNPAACTMLGLKPPVMTAVKWSWA